MSRDQIQLPSKLVDLISSDTNLEAVVSQARKEFGPILNSNSLVFFPEYTDHGIDHIENVISTAFGLIRDEARGMLTAADSAALVLSVILHDIAMHIQKDGFVELVSGNSNHKCIEWFEKRFEEKTWPQLWENYVAETARFSGKKCFELFGDHSPVPAPTLTANADWTEKQHLLVGEFIRRHHGRLAHEIALYGFPTRATAPPITFDTTIGDLANLAGLIARSHTLPLRPCVDYLECEYNNKRDPRSIHVPFLMGLLRIADYLQVDSERASSQLLRLKSLRSPFSLGEWNLHLAIQEVNTSHDDRESIVVSASPQDATTYLKTKKLLDGIQSELDHSWALLGEVYGPILELHGLGFTIRRIRSNLDDEADFANKINYVPEPITFKAADASLLKLLVEPLYGDRPDVGVRELIQNAVDSVLEFRIHPKHEKVQLGTFDNHRRNQRADVVVSFEEDEQNRFFVTVADCGKGMDAEIIKNYFLRVGASFRMSDAWRKEYEKNGKSTVLRSGRFGIGVLAAFLIGKEIEVKTRHVDCERGIKFKATIDTDPIDIRFVDSIPVGTEIRIQTTSKVHKMLRESILKSPWYRLDSPSLRVTINGVETKNKKAPLTGRHEALEEGWFRIENDNFDDIQWTYCKDARTFDQALQEYDKLIVNGIVVKRDNYLDRFFEPNNWVSDLVLPVLSVFDSNGRFPLSLDRMRQVGRLPFADALATNILMNVIALGLTSPKTVDGNPIAFFNHLRHPALARARHGPCNCWFFTESGFGLVDRGILDSNFREPVFITDRLTPFSATAICNQTPFLCFQYLFGSLSQDSTKKWLNFATALNQHRAYFNFYPVASQVLLGKRWASNATFMQSIPQYIQRNMIKVRDFKNATLFTSDPSKTFQLKLLEFVEANETTISISDEIRVAQWITKKRKKETQTSGLSKLWHSLVPNEIPLDLQSKEAIKRSVYDKLKQHIDYWEKRFTS